MKFKKRIIQPKRYSVPVRDATGKVVGRRQENVGKKRIKKWVDDYKRMTALGLRVPAPWKHDPKAEPLRFTGNPDDFDAFNNAGFWDKLWQDKQGALWGQVDVPREEDASRLQANEDGTASVEDCSLLAKDNFEDGDGNVFTDSITHIALVTHPVAKDSTKFTPIPEGAIALSLGDLDNNPFIALADDDIDNMNEDSNNEEQGMNASGSTVRDVLKMLDEVANIRLPADTSGDNLLERLAVVLHALQGKEEENDEEDEDTSVKEPSSKSKEQPGPVAMSAEFTLALSLLGNAGVTNPATKQPYTEADLKAKAAKKDAATVTIAMSEEDTAAVNWARGAILSTYKQRLEQCVAHGQVGPKDATELFTAMNAEAKAGSLSFSFSEDGEPVKNQYDFVINSWEKLPKGSTLTGRTPTTSKAQRNDVFGSSAFSIDAAVVEQDPPTDTDWNAPMSDDEADAVLAIQFESAGKRPADIEGGYTKHSVSQMAGQR